MKKYIIYTRVSTQKQGLGLEAQLTMAHNYIRMNGGVSIAEYSEKESGKETINRPILQECINRCKSEKLVLLVAKLDRLSRDVADIFTLRKQKGLNFEVCECDASDTFMLGIIATLAQKEREMISKRTKEALAELKAQGKQLGSPIAAETIRGRWTEGGDAVRNAANEKPANLQAWAAIRYMQGTLREKANYLNKMHFDTPNSGGTWTATQVQRIIKRYSAEQ